MATKKSPTLRRVEDSRHKLLRAALSVLEGDLAREASHYMDLRVKELDNAAGRLTRHIGEWEAEQAKLPHDQEAKVVHVADGDLGQGGDKT